MRILIRIIAILAAISALSALWAAITFVSQGMLVPLVETGWQGFLIVLGWVVGVVLGPFAAVQLWRCRESGRLAGLILFGSGVVLFLAGWLTSSEAAVVANLTRAVLFSLPAVVLWLRPVRRVCQANEPAG